MRSLRPRCLSILAWALAPVLASCADPREPTPARPDVALPEQSPAPDQPAGPIDPPACSVVELGPPDLPEALARCRQRGPLIHLEVAEEWPVPAGDPYAISARSPVVARATDPETGEPAVYVAAVWSYRVPTSDATNIVLLWRVGGPEPVWAHEGSGSTHLAALTGPGGDLLVVQETRLETSLARVIDVHGQILWESLPYDDLQVATRSDFWQSSESADGYIVQSGLLLDTADGTPALTWPRCFVNPWRGYQHDWPQARLFDLDGDGTFELMDPAGVQNWDGSTRFCAGDRTGTFAPAQLDEDPEAELFFLGGLGVVRAYDTDGALLWERADPSDWQTSPAVADLDGDGHSELLTQSAIYDHRGVAVPWGLFDAVADWAPPVLHDFNDDGRIEAILMSPAGLAVFDTGTGQRIGWLDLPSIGNHWVHAVAIVDFDDDGVEEILLGADNPPRLVVIRPVFPTGSGTARLDWPVYTPGPPNRSINDEGWVDATWASSPVLGLPREPAPDLALSDHRAGADPIRCVAVSNVGEARFQGSVELSLRGRGDLPLYDRWWRRLPPPPSEAPLETRTVQLDLAPGESTWLQFSRPSNMTPDYFADRYLIALGLDDDGWEQMECDYRNNALDL